MKKTRHCTVLAIFDGAVRQCDARIVTDTSGKICVYVSVAWTDGFGNGTSANGLFTFDDRGIKWAYDQGEEAQAFYAMAALS